MSKPLLTIVIPYFKRRYLKATLESLAKQTNQDFVVFIGDDGSNESPLKLIQDYKNQLNIEYRRFPDNRGHASLVEHWNRCVRETSSEWVWLFSDDDVASANCVHAFRETLAETDGGFDLYRFNTNIINGEDSIIQNPPRHPLVETEREFLFARFSEGRSSCAIEYIFRRSVFDRANGFVDFPLAWCADDASWIVFSRRTGIRTIQDAYVLWRLSTLNISAPAPELAQYKLKAFRKYLLWLRREFQEPQIQERLRREVEKWFPRQIRSWGGKPNASNGILFWCFFSWYTHHADFRLLRKLVHVPRMRRSYPVRPVSATAPLIRK